MSPKAQLLVAFGAGVLACFVVMGIVGYVAEKKKLEPGVRRVA